MCGPADEDRLANIVATCAFNVAVSGWLAAPGVVFPCVVADYLPDTHTPHVLWSEPINAAALGTFTVEKGLDVHWLLGVPISDAEHALLVDDGYDALQRRLQDADAAYFDPYRTSTI